MHQAAAPQQGGAAEDAPALSSAVPNAAMEGPPSTGSLKPHCAQASPSADAPDPNTAGAASSFPRVASSSRRQGPNVPRQRGSSTLRRGGGAASRRSPNAGTGDGVALPLTAAQMSDAVEDIAGALPPPPIVLDSAAGDSASSTPTVRSRNASYTVGAAEGAAAGGPKPPLGSGLSRLGFGGPTAATAAAAALSDTGPGSGTGMGSGAAVEAGLGSGAASTRDAGGNRGGGPEGASGGEESDAVSDLAGARQYRLGDRISGRGPPPADTPLPTSTSAPLPPNGGPAPGLPLSTSMPHGPRAPGLLQPVSSGAPPLPPMQRDASAFRFDPALLASLRLAPSASVTNSITHVDGIGQPAEPGAAAPADHPRPGAAHHLSFTQHAGRPQGHPSGAVTCSEDTDTDGRPSGSGPSYTGPAGAGPRKASFTSHPQPGPNSGRRRGVEGPQARPGSGAHPLEAVATAAANQVAALLQHPLPSIPSGGLAPGAEDPGIQTLLSLGLVNAAAYRRARQRASEAGGPGAGNAGPGGGTGSGGGGGGGTGSGPQHFAYQQQAMAQMQGGSPRSGVPGRKMRRSSCTEAYGPYAHPQGYGYGGPQSRQLQLLGTMPRAEGGNSPGARSHLNADAAFGMVRRTASVAVPKDAQASITAAAAAAAAAVAAAADAQGGGGNSSRGQQRRTSYGWAG